MDRERGGGGAALACLGPRTSSPQSDKHKQAGPKEDATYIQSVHGSLSSVPRSLRPLLPFHRDGGGPKPPHVLIMHISSTIFEGSPKGAVELDLGRSVNGRPSPRPRGPSRRRTRSGSPAHKSFPPQILSTTDMSRGSEGFRRACGRHGAHLAQSVTGHLSSLPGGHERKSLVACEANLTQGPP